MAVRIAGVNIPEHKHIEIGLTHIFGIGRTTAQNICKKLNIDFQTKVKDLDETTLDRIRTLISGDTSSVDSEDGASGILVEGNLRRYISANIDRLKYIGAYRGVRHRRGLPVRGQRTRTNARTRKGKPKLVKK